MNHAIASLGGEQAFYQRAAALGVNPVSLHFARELVSATHAADAQRLRKLADSLDAYRQRVNEDRSINVRDISSIGLVTQKLYDAAAIANGTNKEGLQSLLGNLDVLIDGQIRENLSASTSIAMRQFGQGAEITALTVSLGSLAYDLVSIFKNYRWIKESAAPARTVEAGSEATGFLGRSGFELKNAPYQNPRNSPANILGRDYSAHALDQMQNRGIMPSVVENTIKNGVKYETRFGTNGYYDSINNLRIILNSENGRVITVIRGTP
jgi:hypothetical protein